MKNIEEVKAYLESKGTGMLALDIDETLANTVLHYVEQMQEVFGNPEGLTAQEIIQKYRYSHMVPYWQSDEHVDWHIEKRMCNESQKELPLIDYAKEVVNEIDQVKKVGLYLTIRPQSVREGSYFWLRNNSFPDAPIFAMPEGIDHSEGNAWKAQVLQELYPYIDSIVDDNPKLSDNLPEEYPGNVYLFGSDEVKNGKAHTIACKTWHDVRVNIK